jgi:Fe-S-cluster containining protein
VEAVRLTKLHRDPDGFILKTKNPVFTEAECVFLGEAGCTVYEGRPEACRTWPLWPRLYEDAAVFEKSRTTCAMLRHLSHPNFKELYSRQLG